MATNYGKKNVAHKGSNHGAVGPGAISLITPPAPPVPTPFVYVSKSCNASGTSAKLLIDKKEVLVKGSTMPLEPPANQPSQSGDIVTHGSKALAVTTTGSVCFTVEGKEVCGVGDMVSMNVLNKNMTTAQMMVPLLEGPDFDLAQTSYGDAAAINRKWRRAYPPSRADQTKAGHPVDLGTGYVVDEAVDLRLPGFLPLVWSRSYTSSSAAHRGALGKGGWTHSFESWLEATESGYRLHDEEGLPVDFAPAGDRGLSFCRRKGLELARRGDGFTIQSVHDQRICTFAALPGGRLALRAVSDPRHHRISLEYDGDVLTRIIDSVGRQLRIHSDARGRITRVAVWASEPGSELPPTLQTWFDYAYHPEGELAAHTNALGHAATWDYDGLHRLVKATLRNGLAFHYEYDPEAGHCVHTWGDGGLHDVHLEIDFEKGETRTHGTSRARRYLWKHGLVWREETFGGEWAVERLRDDDELLVARKNGAGEATTYDHDERGHRVREIDAAGNVSSWEFQGDLLLKYVGPTGLFTRYAHDASGSLVGMALPTGFAYQVERDREGLIAAVHDSDGLRARLTHDAHGNLATETQARGATTRYRHDALGRPVEQTDALGRTSTVLYDAVGAVLERRYRDGTTLVAAYDRLGNLTTMTDALGHVTRLEHTGTGYLARITRADGQVYKLVYDQDERLIQVLNPRLECHDFEYDRADQLIAERTFDRRLLSYRYNQAGRLVRVDYPEGEWRELSHDKLGNVVEDRGGDVQIVFTLDALGRIVKAICQDVTGQVVTEFERDQWGRVTADIQNGRAVRHEYDARGRRTARVLPGGERTEYHHDPDGAFAGVTHAGTRVAIDRDALGRERTRRAASWALESEYDRMDRLATKRIHAAGPGGAARVLGERRYGHDLTGRLTTIEGAVGELTTYRYDRINQLVEATRGAAREVFEYDPTGSLVSALRELDAGGQTLRWSLLPGNTLKATAKARYLNDGRGRRIRRVEGRGGDEADAQVTTYGWDTKDRLREVVLSDGGRVRFTYDALGRRVRKDVIGPPAPLADVLAGTASPPARHRVSFLWDADVLCEEVVSSAAQDARARAHVHEPDTFVPMLQIERGQVFGVVNDHLGMPKELIDDAGRIAWRAQHGAWGNALGEERDGGAAAVKSPFRLLGQYADEEAGLCYTRFRYFEAETGRWLSADPIGLAGGLNLFALDGSPSNTVDPLGLCAPQNGDPAKAFMDRALALQGMDHEPNGFKQKWTEDGQTFEARIHPADAAHGKTGSIFRVGRQAVPDPTNPKAQGSGQSYVDPAGTWHHQSTLLPTFANGNANPDYNPTAAKDTHVQL